MNAPKTRLVELDALRGIAALAVVAFHFTTHFEKQYGHSQTIPLDLSLGRYGVELFFMISGFVIFLTLDKTKRPLDFMVSRFSRLYPAYWAAIPITYFIATQLDLPNYNTNLIDLLFNFSMAQELAAIPHVDNVYWTLHRELGFYVLMALFYYVSGIQRIIPIIISLIFLDLIVVNASLIYEIPGLWRVYAALPIAQLHLFGFGVALYAVQHNKINRVYFLLFSATCLTNSALAIDLQHAITIGMIFILVIMATQSKLQIIRHKPFLYFGAISYPLYLIHNNAGSAIIIALEQKGISTHLSILYGFIFAVLTATAIHFYIEKPALSSIRTWYRNRHASR